MPVSIAVFDPLPVYRQGMLTILAQAGFAAESPEDLLHWARQEPRTVVMLTLETAPDWELLARLRSELPEVVVVAVLTDADVQSSVRAVAAGATTVVARDAAPKTMLRVFEDAVRGVSALPIGVVAALAAMRAVEHGAQAAVMAPTELLAKQHARNFHTWLDPLGLRVALRAARRPPTVRASGQYSTPTPRTPGARVDANRTRSYA